MSKKENSYGQILKSSSIIGGAQGLNYLIGMVRTKMVAVLLGPSGMGLVSLYVTAIGLVETVSRFGIDSSGVREVAEAHGSGNAEKIARTVITLRRMCWLTGIFGWLLTAGFSYPLSVWTFGSGERAWAIGILGVTILIGSVSGGQSSIIQGTRRIGDLARINVLGAVAGTLIAIGLYAWLGQRGIVPVIITTATTNLGFSWWFARKIPVVDVSLTWPETFHNSKQLVQLGMAFMYGIFLGALVGLGIRALIVRELGLDAAGIYQAAWGISGMFSGFIIKAMGVDFYPRLTIAVHDNEKINTLVNEQTEIGILLALPGLLGTLAFAPWIMQIFYSSKFIVGSQLLPCFVLGVFLQVISWPYGMILMAKGSKAWMFFCTTEINAVQIVLTIYFIKTSGLVGVAWAFVLFTFIHGLVTLFVAKKISGFMWSRSSLKLIFLSFCIIGCEFLVNTVRDQFISTTLGAIIAAGGSLIVLRLLSVRLGVEHRFVKIIMKIPGVKFASGFYNTNKKQQYN
jgi:PST family polysaccharide transporter